MVIKKVIEHYGLDKKIGEIIGKDSGLFLDLAAYVIVAENNASQYYPDYEYNHPLFTNGMKVYSDSKISRFLRDISRDDSISFQNEWNAGHDHREKIYISYDSTNKHCQAGDVDIAEYGHEKDKQKKPVFNFSIAYNKNNRLPLFYEVYPGSINDMSQLQCMLEKAKAYGYKNAGFILDRGYFSDPNIKPNIKFMDANGYEFIIMVKGCRDLASRHILDVKGTFEDEWSNAIPYYDVNGITVKGYILPKDGREILQLVREKSDAVSRDIKLCGYFCKMTSEEMTASEALTIYKSRDGSEKLFRGDKSYLGERSMRVNQTLMKAVPHKVWIPNFDKASELSVLFLIKGKDETAGESVFER